MESTIVPLVVRLALAAALGIASVMIVAIVLIHRSNGFFMNWYGSQAGEGFEYRLLALGLAVALIVGGAGAWSPDALVASWGHA